VESDSDGTCRGGWGGGGGAGDTTWIYKVREGGGRDKGGKRKNEKKESKWKIGK
jgi:hypothetical protein